MLRKIQQRILSQCKQKHEHSLSFMKKILPKYFDSEWSFAQFRVPDAKTICAFTSDNHIIGEYWLMKSDQHGRELLSSLVR